MGGGLDYGATATARFEIDMSAAFGAHFWLALYVMYIIDSQNSIA